METEEIEVQPVPEPNKHFILSESALYYLHTAAKWANFLAIVGFIGCGFIVLAALFIGTIFTAIGNLSPMGNQFPAGAGAAISVIYLVFAVINFFFSLYMYQFSSRVKKALFTFDNDVLTGAFEKLKSFFKLWGILTIVIFGLYILIIIIVIIAGVGAASMMHGASGTNTL